MNKVLLKDTLLYTLSSFFSKGIGFLLLPLYTRVFSTSDYGVMDMISIVIVLINNLSSLQVNQALSRYYVDTGSLRRKKSYFTTTVLYYILIYFFISLIVFLYSKEISIYLFNDEKFSNVMIVTGLNIFFGSIYYIFVNLYRLEFNSKKFTILSLLQLLISTIFTIYFLLVLKTGLIGVFIAQLISYCIIILIVFREIIVKIQLNLISFRVMKKMLRFGVPLVPAVLILLIMQFVDRLMISNMLGLDFLGIYAVGMKISSIIVLLLAGFQLSFGPYVYKNYKDLKTKEFMALFFYGINLFGLILVSFLLLFSYEILYYLTTAKYIEAYSIIPILALSSMFFSIGSFFSVGFAINNKNEIQSLIYIFIIIVNIVLNYLFISYFGLIGAAYATAISFLISAYLNVSFSNKYYTVSYNVKKVLVFWIVFSLIVIFNSLLIKNDNSMEDQIFKCGVFLIWIIPILFLEKTNIIKLYNIIKKKKQNV